MQHEKVNNILNICSNCLVSGANTHNINLLYSGKFTDVNFTYSKLAKSLHLKIGAKVIKKLNTNKLNYKIMMKEFKKRGAQTVQMYENNGFFHVRWYIFGKWQEIYVTRNVKEAENMFYWHVLLATNQLKYIKEV